MKIGYARISTNEQHLDLQIDALIAAGCDKDHIYRDTISGSKEERKGLNDLLKALREGDILVIWKLDRLGRSLKQLIDLVNKLKEKGVELISLKDNFETVSPGGKLIFHIFGAIAEFERDIIRQRTYAGLEAARARGRQGGRPKSLDESRIKQIKMMYEQKTVPLQEICDTFGITKPTLYRAVRTV